LTPALFGGKSISTGGNLFDWTGQQGQGVSERVYDGKFLGE